jgi:hypothetical protein
MRGRAAAVHDRDRPAVAGPGLQPLAEPLRQIGGGVGGGFEFDAAGLVGDKAQAGFHLDQELSRRGWRGSGRPHGRRWDSGRAHSRRECSAVVWPEAVGCRPGVLPRLRPVPPVRRRRGRGRAGAAGGRGGGGASRRRRTRSSGWAGRPHGSGGSPPSRRPSSRWARRDLLQRLEQHLPHPRQHPHRQPPRPCRRPAGAFVGATVGSSAARG